MKHHRPGSEWLLARYSAPWTNSVRERVPLHLRRRGRIQKNVCHISEVLQWASNTVCVCSNCLHCNWAEWVTHVDGTKRSWDWPRINQSQACLVQPFWKVGVTLGGLRLQSRNRSLLWNIFKIWSKELSSSQASTSADTLEHSPILHYSTPINAVILNNASTGPKLWNYHLWLTLPYSPCPPYSFTIFHLQWNWSLQLHDVKIRNRRSNTLLCNGRLRPDAVPAVLLVVSHTCH